MRWLVLALFVMPAAAWATPHDLPYSYPYATLAADAFEVEQYTDFTPVPGVAASTGEPFTTPLFILTTELEYGLTDKLELGLYFQASDDPGLLTGSNAEAPLQLDGIKQRLRYRIAEPGALPVDVSVYGEVSELQTELELEAKLNLEKDFGPVRCLVNLWGEREFYFDGTQEWVANPTAGMSWEVHPALHLGLEYWMHAEFGRSGPPVFNEEPHHFLGPALMYQGTHFWVTVAPYVRLDRWSHQAEVGADDQYGLLWVRTIIGYSF